MSYADHLILASSPTFHHRFSPLPHTRTQTLTLMVQLAVVYLTVPYNSRLFNFTISQSSCKLPSRLWLISIIFFMALINDDFMSKKSKQKQKKGVVMVNFYNDYVTCSHNATLDDVAGTLTSCLCLPFTFCSYFFG